MSFVRYLGVDFGRRRIGLALSDASATIASPWRAVSAGDSPLESARRIVAALDVLDDPLGVDAPVGAIVVGLPRRLDGSDNDATAPARELVAALQTLTGVAVHLQDERLTSREAEALLAEREPDWRRRKARVDATAAALILQDHLDARVRSAAGNGRTDA